ncbi:hypothetical protein [Nonomuraea wenchangensis]|uniref:Uncharacterized protein n=1 Tax=Nonomuraea wenchangensis TaxID=568860 RepID=A0A1I0F2U0_9ACTN|nr:hypothetical protein [Nonomuraea wenchangensis]SET52327.1 hypothetical protein SAMN05421811_103303 [Nonomuraea wenchangensis]
MISEKRAKMLAIKYRSKVPFIIRLAEFSAALAAGVDRWDALRQLGFTNDATFYRYLRWEERLRDELAAPDDDTPSDEGDNA